MITMKKLEEIWLENDYIKVSFLNFGARIYKIYTKDKFGTFENILLSLDRDYIIDDFAYFGASIGRVAGRISKLNDYDFTDLVYDEQGINTHSGKDSWAEQFWTYTKRDDSLEFYLRDQSKQYQGELTVCIKYELQEKQLIMTTSAKSPTDTFLNPTNHAYFNLSGNARESIYKHYLQVNSSKVLELDTLKLPTGKTLSVENTPLDFRKEKKLATSLEKLPAGIDDYFILDHKDLNINQLKLIDFDSGRKMTIKTNRAGFVLFSSSNFNADFCVNQGQKMKSQLGLAIEAQEEPDAPNHKKFTDIGLKTNEIKTFTTIYEFDTI